MVFFPGAKNLFLAVYIITFTTGLPLNILAICTFVIKFRRKLVPVDILLFNLTISDLLLLTFLPFRMVEASSGMFWKMPYVFCPLSNFLYFSSIYLTTLFLTAVSVERYLGVAFPIKYKLLHRPLYSIIASAFIWIITISHCSIIYIVQIYVPANETKTSIRRCYTTFSPEQLSILLPVRLWASLLLFCIPLTITFFCYIKFVRIIISQPHINRKRKQRAIGLVVTTLVNFIICFLPYNISHIVGFVQGESPHWRVYALLLSTLNASIDPIIFYFSSSSFKKTFLEGIVRVGKKLHLGGCWYGVCQPLCESEIENTVSERSSSGLGSTFSGNLYTSTMHLPLS
ncbi:free fatty acid receptor 3-like [Rhinatrema bivittatum]|uniref:free fatty acid receptor 3-like n=1 Tax=Rhinatrema bivittatum TaxID=194408 RepID=UPI0011267DBA|nr:free fatty acid receptor 3-like [Rhinatrema bivittatum]